MSRCSVCGKHLTKSTGIGPVCEKKKAQLNLPEVDKEKINYSHIVTLSQRLKKQIKVFNQVEGFMDEKNIIESLFSHLESRKEQLLELLPDNKNIKSVYGLSVVIADLADDVLSKLPVSYKVNNEDIYTIVANFYELIGKDKCGEDIRNQIRKDKGKKRIKEKYQNW